MDHSWNVGAIGCRSVSYPVWMTPSVGPIFLFQNIPVREMMKFSLGIGSCPPTEFFVMAFGGVLRMLGCGFSFP